MTLIIKATKEMKVKMEVSPTNYHFAGWATCSNVLCSDGRTIMPDAFKHHDGEIVPLVWNHQHNDVNNVLGKALLHSRDGGIYAYGLFNDTESGRAAKELVDHGDVSSLSICANQLKHNANRGVTHGMIRELSLVLAGANPGAHIENVMKHGEDCDDEAVIYNGENIILFHTEDVVDDEDTDVNEEADTEQVETDSNQETELEHNENQTEQSSDDESNNSDSDDETVGDVLKTLTETQKKAVAYVIAEAVGNDDGEDEEDEDEEIEHSEGGNEMKTNVFDNETVQQATVLTHADQQTILSMAKSAGVGSLREAIKMFVENNETLSHAISQDEIGTLFPEYKNITPGAPEILRADQSWVMSVINKIHKSPYSRIRTRYADARIADLKAKGYQKKGDQKKLTDTIKLLGRTFDPQTVYIKDEVHRDDILDIEDFSYVDYILSLMKDNMYETLALAALVGDGRDDLDPDKIKEDHIHSIWNDDELYTIHADVDIEAMRQKLQGTETGAHFGEEFIYAEAIIAQALYAREKYKGTGKPDLYCDTHLVNVMLLARDLNGRRIYDSKADLAKALNVGEIHEIEQLAGRTRTDGEGNTKKLLGLFVNLADYQFGSVKGGEITKFEDFDINFNKYQYLMETRLSGALVKPYAAIALEEPVTEVAG